MIQSCTWKTREHRGLWRNVKPQESVPQTSSTSHCLNTTVSVRQVLKRFFYVPNYHEKGFFENLKLFVKYTILLM